MIWFGYSLATKMPIEISSDSSDSIKSYDYNSDDGPTLLKNGATILFWDTIITDHIKNRSDVMVILFFHSIEYRHYFNLFE